MDNLVQKTISYMERYHMLLPGERAVAGISGGADSVCLLFVLLEWQKLHGLEFAAVHVNHGIRREAAEDARFVEELCRRHDIPFYLREEDVHGYAARRKCSEEEAGRILRYEAFEEVAEEFQAEKIAVAHNLNDRAETVLFNLFRGSGTRGLAGILPVREGTFFGGYEADVRVIRPLLCLERSEIESFLAEMGQDFCRDITNEGDAYTRNRIRHHILPYAEREIAPGCARHIGNTAELLAETEEYLEQQTKAALESCCVSDFEADETLCDGQAAVSYRIDVQKFLAFHRVLQRRMLHSLIKSLSPGAKDISRVHVEDMLTLFTLEANRRQDLPFGIRGRREYGTVTLRRGQNASPGALLEEWEAEFSVLPAEKLEKNEENSFIFPENEYTKWFDYDKIKGRPVIRTRQTGDFLTIADEQGGTRHKSLKSYMITEKIPESRRGSIPVLAEDSHVVWLVGYRISEYYKITENTKRVLQVQLKRKT